MAAIPSGFVDDLIQRTDIVDIIGSRVQLKKMGNSLKSCCPFHDEKTPSFNVHAIKQYYHCFGCGVGGNTITFLMEYERMSFREAVEYLAKRLGMEMPKQLQPYRPKINPDVLSVLEVAGNYYRQLLATTEPVKGYVRHRGLDQATIERFQLGFAQKQWQTLIDHSVAHFKAVDNPQPCLDWLERAGLIIKKDKGTGYYDRFRNRLMFPIRNIKGQIIGFGGRVIEQSDTPKYLNSPETELFHKSRELYGLYEAISQRQALDTTLVVEGYMDVIALAQYGINNAVATMGTAIAKSHLQKLFKYCQQVVFCFDGDAAGQQAANRALEVCLPEMIDGRQVSFLILDNNDDPDSLIREHGVDYFQHAIANATKLSAYLLQQSQKDVDINSIEGKALFVGKAMQLIALLPSATLIEELLLEEISTTTQLSVDRIKKLAKPVATPKTSYCELSPPPPEDEYTLGDSDEPPLAIEQPVNLNPLIVVNQMLRYLFINPAIADSEEMDWTLILAQENGEMLNYVLAAIKNSVTKQVDIETYLAYFSAQYPQCINDFMSLYQKLELQFGLQLDRQQALEEFKALYQSAIVKPMQVARVKQQLESIGQIPFAELTTEQKQTQSILFKQLAALAVD